MIKDALIKSGVQVFPCWIRHNPNKNKFEKGPAIPKNTSWQTVDPLDPRLNWNTGCIGIAIPAGVVVLDLDTQKGVTRADVEAFLGVRLPWESALIQNTPSGGAHYAFKTSENMHQRSDWIEGFDTRTAGAGFICSGDLYPSAGNFGPYALCNVAALPEFPTNTPIVSVDRGPLEPAPLPDPTTRDEESLISALKYCDPTARADWLTVGLALRNYYHDDPDAGFRVFDAWSRGEYWPDGCPDSYNPDTQFDQWASFKASKGGREVKIGTVYHMAVQSGWIPPRQFDTAAAFGAGGASSEEYDAAIDEIQAIGGDPKQAAHVVAMIQRLDGSALQRAMLGALLRRQLKEDGLLTKELDKTLEQMIGVKGESNVTGLYGKNHSQNAVLFLDEKHPDGCLVRVLEVWYAFDGRSWVELSDDAVRHNLAVELAPTSPQNSTISGTYSLLEALTYREDLTPGDVPNDVLLVQNGVLNVNTLELFPHDKNLFTTNIMPYNYNPGALCPTWIDFLNDITGGDVELMDLLQEWFGYMLVNDYRHQKIFFILGPRRSGKGTIGRILNRLVGDQNFAGADLSDLTENKFLETLPTKTVMYDGDVAKSFKAGSEAITKKLKTISGNDRVTIPRLYKRPLNLYLPTRFTLAGNHLPRLFDDSGALAGRILMLPLYKSFYGNEDLYLFDKLANEIEGIANWALAGLMRLNQKGKFTEPAASREELNQMAEQYSPIKQFVDTQLHLGGEFITSSVDLYEHYRNWALNEGEDQIRSRKALIGDVKDVTRGAGVTYGPHRINGEVVRGFKGVVLRNDDAPPRTAAAFSKK
ncbi:MAG: hypothetical protein CMG60_07895 [Candidatus Marinimicrobia bacterium]|nr:hypothetical protein [Candidatus Neomarinimicrobiota bacterium]|tara:strand:+ start:29810 stop:32251 length:2442 start_codon:yes stop_codon:yes gene_type:complete